MKTNSLVYKRTALLAAALATSSILAINMTGCITIQTSGSSSASSESASSASIEEASSSEAPQASSNAATSNDAELSDKEALQKALSHAGFKESEIHLVSNIFEVDDGIPRYTMEFIGPDDKEYEYEIDANTGEVLDRDVD